MKIKAIYSSRSTQMTTELIHDRGCGAEIRGTRITVYDLLPHFLDPSKTEAYICDFYDLTAEQVAAARAYILNHTDQVLAEHLQIEARIAAGNPPEVIERAKKARSTLVSLKEWLVDRKVAGAQEQTAQVTSEAYNN